MAKDAYYFSHDSNARHDPKCSALIHDYGMQGYGLFWALIEILSEQEDYKLKKFNKLYDGLARQLNVEVEAFRSIASALLNDYELLVEDDSFIWSESLLSRMQLKEEKRARRVNAGRKGGLKSGESRSSRSNASAMLKQNEAKRSKESKVNESKVNEIETNSSSNAYRTFESEGFGTLSGILADKIDDMCTTYTERWVIEAMKKSVLQGKRTLSYTDGILKRWKADGIDEPWNKEVNNSGNRQNGKDTIQYGVNPKSSEPVKVFCDAADWKPPAYLVELNAQMPKMSG